MDGRVHDFLEEIAVRLPGFDIHLNREILALLDKTGLKVNERLRFSRSDNNFYPMMSIDTNSENKRVSAGFLTSKGCKHEVMIENTTGKIKKNPLKYSHLSIDDITDRFNKNAIMIYGLDHIGFNLPWFSSGIHPLIENLRRDFSSKCLYHKFPTGEPWDFILPSVINEISSSEKVDYSKTRKPKFEIVSFSASSVPLIQFDVQCDEKYEVFSRIFPESIDDNQLRNIWIYIENPYNVDICFVLNESSNSDWSFYFKDSRILS